MIVVKNKWNNNLYEVINDLGKTIELRRYSEKETFTINKSEYNFSYIPCKKDLK